MRSMSVAEQKKKVRTCACVHACARVSLWVCARAASRLGVQVHMRVRRRVGGRRCVCAMTVMSANVAAGVAILKLEFCFKAQRPHYEANDARRGLLVTISVSLSCTFRSMSFALFVSFDVSVATFLLAFSLASVH